MDQALFAGSNFALNILLASWLTPREYGVFSLAFAVYLFALSLHQATIQEPMLVFGPGRYKGRLPEYLGTLVYGHFAFSAVFSLAFLLAGTGFALWGPKALSTIMMSLAAAGPFILLLFLMRRACYVRLEPHLATSGGAWYLIFMLGGAYLLYRTDWLSASSVLGVMGISSLAVSLWLAVRLRVRFPPLRDGELVRDSFATHLKYGKWSVPNQALNWIPMNMPYLVLPILGGLAAGGSFKALMNLISPMLQGIWSLSNLALPALVRAREKGRAAFNSRLRFALISLVLVPAVYWVCLGLAHYPLISWLYDGRYAEHSELLWLLGLSPIFAAAKLIMGNSLRAHERPDWLLLAHAIPAAAALTLGTWLMYLWGVAGAGASLLLSQVVTVVLITIICRRVLLPLPDTPGKQDMSREHGSRK